MILPEADSFFTLSVTFFSLFCTTWVPMFIIGCRSLTAWITFVCETKVAHQQVKSQASSLLF